MVRLGIAPGLDLWASACSCEMMPLLLELELGFFVTCNHMQMHTINMYLWFREIVIDLGSV